MKVQEKEIVIKESVLEFKNFKTNSASLKLKDGTKVLFPKIVFQSNSAVFREKHITFGCVTVPIDDIRRAKLQLQSKKDVIHGFVRKEGRINVIDYPRFSLLEESKNYLIIQNDHNYDDIQVISKKMYVYKDKIEQSIDILSTKSDYHNKYYTYKHRMITLFKTKARFIEKLDVLLKVHAYLLKNNYFSKTNPKK